MHGGRGEARFELIFYSYTFIWDCKFLSRVVSCGFFFWGEDYISCGAYQLYLPVLYFMDHSGEVWEIIHFPRVNNRGLRRADENYYFIIIIIIGGESATV